MQARVQKLLILVGEEGSEFEARDFRKLNEVIVGQYLPDQSIPYFRNFFTEMFLRVIRKVSLKQHFYAGLTASLTRVAPDLAIRIMDAAYATLQSDITAGNMNETLNVLGYLAELMNISLLNSLVFANLLQDIANAIELEQEESARQCILSIIVRTLPVCAYSLNEKTYFQFKRFLDKLKVHAEKNPLFQYIHTHFTKSKLQDLSLIPRLEADFTDLPQHNPKWKINVSAAVFRNRPQPEYYASHREMEDQLEKEFNSNEGELIKCNLERLIDNFQASKATLTLKFINLLNSQRSTIALKYVVNLLVYKSIKSRHPFVEQSLLLSLCAHQNYQKDAPKFVENCLLELFGYGQTFDFVLMLSFANMLSFLNNNWLTEWDWSGYLEGEENFLKRHVLLKIIFQKLALLNDKFVAPVSMQKYECPRPLSCEEQYINGEEAEIFEKFTEELKHRTPSEEMIKLITSQQRYEIFLEALFRRTSQSQTHLNILSERYAPVLTTFAEYDWTLINKVRNFFKNSMFHRLHYLKHLLSKGFLLFNSYVKYIGGLTGKSQIDMTWIKVELNELNIRFGKKLK